ncbi:Hypothetical predicted protein [Lecanosticta acicola]|uniref:BRCT domain-containing protein n=1 Tax=Lecanosticta acicola TaxID=111012 RepID=A0AAI8Z3B5_9PEZI|nr:Hypothetical predicted protein [Lecanosticta acicola]
MPANAPPVAKPSKSIFDPFNSSATGHQRADNRLGGSTSWRESRSRKLREQFNAGAGGGKRVSDTVGAGSLDFGRDGRTENGGWVKGAKGLRTGGQRSLGESMKIEKREDEGGERAKKRIKMEEEKPTAVVNPFTPFRKQHGTVRETSWTSHEQSPSDLLEPLVTPDPSTDPIHQTQAETSNPPTDVAETKPPPQIFSSLNFYINGSTAPHSDHRIKHLLSTHGGNISIALGRRTVTHVIIGRPNNTGDRGCGGGLAGSKIQKEVARTGGKAVRFVTADWVVESVEAGKRLPESRYQGVNIAPNGVKGIGSMFKPKEKQ